MKRRLVGALILLLLAFVLAFLLPDPDRPHGDDGVHRVTIDLRNPEGAGPAPQAEAMTPPTIAVSAPEVSPAELEAAALESAEPQIEIEEPAPAAPRALPPVSIKPSDSLAQQSLNRVTPPPAQPQNTPVQLRQSEVLHDLQPRPQLAVAEPEPPRPPPARPPAPKPVAPKLPPKAEPPKPAEARPEAAPKPVVAGAPVPSPATPKPIESKPATPKPVEAKPEAVKPAPPVVASTPAASVRIRWTVQVGSYAEITNARTAEAKLKAAGLPTLMSPVDTVKGTLYRVRIGPLGSEEQASAAKAKAMQLGFAQATMRKD